MTHLDECFYPEIEYDFLDNKKTYEKTNNAYSSGDALIDCINRCGYVDLNFMCEISGLSIDKLISDLRGTAIFQDPELFNELSKWSLEDG